MDIQKVNYLMQALQMKEDVLVADPQNPALQRYISQPIITGTERTALISELVTQLTATTPIV